MTTEVLLFDTMGTPVANVNVVPMASWILNDVGDATFRISLTDYHAKEEFLGIGNIVVINHDKLPSWVGFIDASMGRKWSAGSVEINALSAECIFNHRITFPVKMGSSPGRILRTLLDLIRRDNDGGIEIHPGSIFMGGRYMRYPMNGSARTVVNYISSFSKCDWDVTHEITNGRLKLYVNLYEGNKGEKRERVLDARNTELFDPLYTEEGEIWNHVVFYTTTGGLKKSREWRDPKSIGRYGLRQYLGEANSGEQESLEWMARAWLYEHAYPRGIVAPSIIDHNDTFAEIQLGNVYRWENHGIGFDAAGIGVGDDVRLTGFEMDYGTNKIAATVESTTRPYTIQELFNM